jgi:trk system potassium uptake protein
MPSRFHIRAVTSNPLIGSFLGVISAIFLGAFFLQMPAISGMSLSVIDALFLAVSALTVTGLSPVDISQMHFGGQLIVLILIQVGMIGVATAGLVFFAFMKRRMALSVEQSAQSLVGTDIVGEVISTLRFMGAFIFIAEILAAFSLFLFLPAELQGIQRVWYAIFHALSAFGNAGLSLWSESLKPLSGWALVVVSFWVIVGGIGILAFRNIWNHMRKNMRLTLTTRVTLGMTLGIICVGAGLLLLLETMHGMNVGDAFFWIITARNAGFSTGSIAELGNSSWMLLCFIMLIGGGPMSFTGGLRVTSIFILGLVVWKSLFSYSFRPIVSGRKIPVISVRRVIVVAGLFAILGGGLMLAFLAASTFELRESMFEFISALTTTGLSMGITENLSWQAKSILICAMLTGRAIPLLAVYAVGRLHEQHRVDYLEEDIVTG